MNRIIKYLFVFFITICFGFSSVKSQNEGNIWYFGNEAGLDFNSGKPSALLDGQMWAIEGCAIICDIYGGLLFYTDGDSVWNRKHETLPNGTGLAGGESASQSSIFVPHPENENLYYLFTVDDVDGLNGFRYSVIDLELDYGLGDVIPDKKNILLMSSTCEKITAVKHADKSSVWLIGHEFPNNIFRVWLIDKDGFRPEEVKRWSIGTIHTPEDGDISSSAETLGCMKLSQKGNKLAVAITYLKIFELFDFNTATGEISNPVIIADNLIGPYGVEFSPNEKFLYGSSRQGKEIYQWDIEAPDIRASIKEIGKTDFANGSLQLAPDGKIYLASYEREYLGVINNPDSAGTASDFIQDGIFLDGKTTGEGLPNMISSIPYKPLFSMENSCLGDLTRFRLLNTNNIDSLKWIFDNNSPDNYSFTFDTTFTFNETGAYNIKLITSRLGHMDTIIQKLNISPYPDILFGNDTTGCINSPIILDAGKGSHKTYSWNDGSDRQILEINKSGDYSVTVSKNNCSSEKTIHATFYDKPVIKIDSVIQSDCNDNTGEIRISVSGASGKVEIFWEGEGINQTGPVAKDLFSGVYYVQVIDENLCPAYDTIIVKDHNAPEIEIFADKYPVCYGDEIKLMAGDADNFEWSTGDTTQNIIITAIENKDYLVKGTNNNGCSNHDIISISVNPLPESSLAQDITGCIGEEIILDAGEGDYTYLWSTSSTEREIPVRTDGLYSVTLTDTIGCSNNFSVNLIFNPRPRVDLGYFRAICQGDTIILDAGEAEKYIWNTGEESREKIVTSTGNYRVIIINEFSCEGKDEIYIQSNDPENLIISSVEQENIKCLGDNNGILKINASGSSAPLLYSIDGGLNFFENEGEFNNLYSDTLYSVAVMEEGACLRFGNSYSFEDPPKLNINTTIIPPSCVSCTNGLLKLEAYGGVPPYTYEWWDFEGGDSRINLSEGLYSALIIDANLCKFYFQTELLFSDNLFLNIPTAFTPNNDGINDIWEFKNKELFPGIIVRVYNNKGKLVFKSQSGYINAWDGTFNGSPLPTGSYFYIIENVSYKKTINGNVSIIR
ncbi:gliding motility-associated C-terminal domain-containing protein [Bacteroidota bacterium]